MSPSASGADAERRQTHGRATRWSGRPHRLRLCTTSMWCHRCAAADPCEKFAPAWPGRRRGRNIPEAGLMRGFRILAVATAAVTYALVVLGGVVRVSGSGLGCPDWPLCHGHLLPPLQLHVLIEYGHRTAATLASLLILATALIAWRLVGNRPDLRVGATISVLLLVVQIGLGGITVLFELPAGIVLAHLATAVALLGAVCVTAAAAWLPAGRDIDR